jgi:hypothetical protein
VSKLDQSFKINQVLFIHYKLIGSLETKDKTYALWAGCLLFYLHQLNLCLTGLTRFPGLNALAVSWRNCQNCIRLMAEKNNLVYPVDPVWKQEILSSLRNGKDNITSS